ncbi:MAG: GDP-mannose mannosyl hydrolase [Neptuniibacter sp.]
MYEAGGWLSPELFKTIVSSTPLISIDLIIENADGKYLLGLRKNKPAQGHLFVPGGRIQKGESISDAFSRITKDELGKKYDFSEAVFNGVFEHMYEDSYFSEISSETVSTHYIVLAYSIKLDSSLYVFPKKQHDSYTWLSKTEVLVDSRVHFYSQCYFKR